MAFVITAALFAVLGGQSDPPSGFYSVAAQVLPAFLVALALERSLLDSLGTKTSFAKTRRDEYLDQWPSSGLSGGILWVIEHALFERTSRALTEKGAGPASILVSDLAATQALLVVQWQDDAMTWTALRDRFRAEFGLRATDADYFERDEEDFYDPSQAFNALGQSVLQEQPGPSIQLLAALAVLRHGEDLSEGRASARHVADEAKRLHDAYVEQEREQTLRRITHRANVSYERQRTRRTYSLRISLVLLTVTECVALVGVLSPGRPYHGLFILTVALVVASILNVTGGALVELAGGDAARHDA
jgi:hypothetical protein